jgi:hypothetical protein
MLRPWMRVALRVIAWYWIIFGPISTVVGVVLVLRFERTGLGDGVPLANVWAWGQLLGGIVLMIAGYWILRRTRQPSEP